MSEEEKKVIKTAKCIRAGVPVQTCDDDYIVLLNIIEKQQKEIEKYKNVISNLNNNWISKEELKYILEKLKVKEQEMSDEQGYWGGSELQGKIEIIEELLGE